MSIHAKFLLYITSKYLQCVLTVLWKLKLLRKQNYESFWVYGQTHLTRQISHYLLLYYSCITNPTIDLQNNRHNLSVFPRQPKYPEEVRTPVCPKVCRIHISFTTFLTYTYIFINMYKYGTRFLYSIFGLYNV